MIETSGSALDRLLGALENCTAELTVPAYWLLAAGSGRDRREGVSFYRDVVEDLLARPVHPLPKLAARHYVIAQVFLQHLTAYNHGAELDGADRASLLKTIAVLPMLARAGFNAIMLLPHYLRSEVDRKGDRGSPYSVKDYYRIDPELHDPLVAQSLSIEDLFEAFIEASHRLGMRVFIDMVPRTAARDSLWILEDPSWFYWIRPENQERLISLLQTTIPGLKSPSPVTAEIIQTVLEHMPMEDIMGMFEWDPQRQDPKRWAAFAQDHREDPDLLGSILKEFGVVTPPCVSDCVNDPQPPWSDVTPLRLFADYCPEITQALSKIDLSSRPPFFIQPIIKASNFPGETPMKGLWDHISKVTNYYEDKFHVDGVRGDMFHALPPGLIKGIKSGLADDFFLIMENLSDSAGEALSVKYQFHIYTGDFFDAVQRGPKQLQAFITETAAYHTPVLAMPVLHDSWPLFDRPDAVARFQLAVGAFVPNSAYAFQVESLLPNRLPINYGLGFEPQDQQRFDAAFARAGRKLAMFYRDYLTAEWDGCDGSLVEFTAGAVALRRAIFGADQGSDGGATFAGCELLDEAVLAVDHTLADGRRVRLVANGSEAPRILDLGSGLTQVHVVVGAQRAGEMLTLQPWGMALLCTRGLADRAQSDP